MATAKRTRNHQIQFRLDDKEYRLFCQRVQSSGLTKQEFQRRAALGVPITNTDGLKELLPEIRDIQNNLNRVGNNLNQISKNLNGFKKQVEDIGLQDRNVIGQLQAACSRVNTALKEKDEIWQQLRQLTKAEVPPPKLESNTLKTN